MLVVELLFALLLNQVLVTMVGQYDFTEREEKLLFEHFGTFPRAMLTMFQVTLGTWVPIARILQETVGPAMNIFTILHKVTIGFACIGVINGVFMQVGGFFRKALRLSAALGPVPGDPKGGAVGRRHHDA